MNYSIEDKRRRFLRRERHNRHCSYRKKTTAKKLDVRINYLEDDDVDTGPSRIKNRRGRHAWWSFPFDEYFRSKVGQKWDDVYHEVCSIVDHRSRNAREFYHDLNIYYPRKYWDYFGSDENGILKEYEYRYDYPKPPAKEPNFVEIDSYREYQKINGIWYYVERTQEESIYYVSYYGCPPERFYRYVFLKRQLGKKALRDFKRDFLPKAIYSKHVTNKIDKSIVYRYYIRERLIRSL